MGWGRSPSRFRKEENPNQSEPIRTKNRVGGAQKKRLNLALGLHSSRSCGTIILVVFQVGFMARCVVAGSAVGSGCVGWLVRPSARSFSGFVLVARFVWFAAASRFAARWAARLGRSVVVRCVPGGWAVSVPVLV
jgi:hypothetical protein